jgi:hypothetical protein
MVISARVTLYIIPNLYYLTTIKRFTRKTNSFIVRLLYQYKIRRTANDPIKAECGTIKNC